MPVTFRAARPRLALVVAVMLAALTLAPVSASAAPEPMVATAYLDAHDVSSDAPTVVATIVVSAPGSTAAPSAADVWASALGGAFPLSDVAGARIFDGWTFQATLHLTPPGAVQPGTSLTVPVVIDIPAGVLEVDGALSPPATINERVVVHGAPVWPAPRALVSVGGEAVSMPLEVTATGGVGPSWYRLPVGATYDGHVLAWDGLTEGTASLSVQDRWLRWAETEVPLRSLSPVSFRVSPITLSGEVQETIGLQVVTDGADAGTRYVLGSGSLGGLTVTTVEHDVVEISGTPSVAGEFDATVLAVTVVDGVQYTLGSVDVHVSVSPGVAPSFTTAPPATVALTAGTPFSLGFVASGSPTPAFWVPRVTDVTPAAGGDGGPGVSLLALPTTLPAGMTFVDNGDGTATLAGTPEAAGVHEVTVEAWNVAGAVSSVVRLEVAAAPSAPPTTAPPTTAPPTTAPPTTAPVITPPTTTPPTTTAPPTEPVAVPDGEATSDAPADDSSDAPTAAPVAGPTDPELPRTGAGAGVVVGLGLAALLAAAGVLVLGVRRRA